MKLKRATITDFKMLGDDGPGRIEGYANVFGVIDSYGDVTMPGTFAQDLPEFLSAGYLTVDHDWSMSAIAGDIVEAREDQRGLFFAAEFYTDEKSQAVRRKMQERIERGKTIELSIGYWTEDQEQADYMGQRVNMLKRARVREVSLVMAAANPASTVASVKSREEEAGDLSEMAERYLARVADIRELGRSEAWLKSRANELRDLGARYLSLADELEPAPVIEAADTGDEDARLLLAALEVLVPTNTETQ
jgi:HK97 family phage prohead protease